MKFNYEVAAALAWCLTLAIGWIVLCYYSKLAISITVMVVLVVGTFWAIGTVKYWLDRL